MMLSQETRDAIRELQTLYPEPRSALIPALHLAQEEVGYLPLEVQAEVARLFTIDPNEVNGIVTFYDMFFDRPVGKHLIRICHNLSCLLRGADPLITHMCRVLNVRPGEITEDGEFTIIPSECLAACDRAPAMIIDDTLIGPVTHDAVEGVLHTVSREHGHPTPISFPPRQDG